MSYHLGHPPTVSLFKASPFLLVCLKHPPIVSLFRTSPYFQCFPPPQIRHLQAFQIHHHRFSSMSLDQFSPPQIRNLWAFQIHHHKLSSMGLNQFSPPQIRHPWAFQIHHHDQTSMGISDSPPYILYHLWALISLSPPQIFIYRPRLVFTTIDYHLQALISFHHHRSDIYGNFRFTTIDQTSMGILDSPPQIFIYGP